MNHGLPLSFFQSSDVVEISKRLLGKILITRMAAGVTAGMIVETEAYAGVEDRASHAFNGKKTARTSVMYREGGRLYVYLIYGMYHLLNIVTAPAGTPHAVLIRALQPLKGVDIMMKRMNRASERRITSGPGLLTRALGITLCHNGILLNNGPVFVEDWDEKISENQIASGARIGVAYAGADAHKPWRFWIKDNPWVSKKS